MTNRRSLSIRPQTIALYSFIVLSLTPAATLQAQPDPFLSTPYYGTETISQGYSAAHPAYDFTMQYEPVLNAGYDLYGQGTIETIGWFNMDPTCLDGSVNELCGLGLRIVLQHLYVGNYRTRYGHLSATAFDLDDMGMNPIGGSVIGTSGNTGWSTGPHLHFEVRDGNNNPVDPFAPNLWEDGQYATPSRPLPSPPTNGEIIVDNTPTNTSTFVKGRGDPFNVVCSSSGCPDWYYTTVAGYAADLHYTPTKKNSGDDYWAKWIPSGIPPGGSVYDIKIYSSSPSNTYGTSWQTPFTVVHLWEPTTRTGRVAQGSLPKSGFSNSNWVSIGTHYLMPGDFVYTTSNTGEMTGAKQVGVDAVKFVRLGTIYLPDAQEGNGWESDIILTSNSGLASVNVVQYSSTGGVLSTPLRVDVPLWGAVWTVPLATTGNSAIIIDASQQIAVAILRRHSSPFSSAAYTGIGNPATEIMIPLVHRNNGGWNNLIYVQNSTASNNTVTVSFKAGPVGSDYTPSNYTVAPFGTLVLDTATLSGLSSPFVGSARVTASQPVAVVYNQYTANFASMIESSALTNLPGTLYAPLIQNNNGGYISGFTLQNGNSSSQTLSATYYNATGGSLCPQNYANIAAYRMVVENPAPPSGCTSTAVLSAQFTTSGSKMSSQVNQIVSGTPQWSGYPAIAQPTPMVLVPRIYKNVNGWSSGLQVQNTGTGSTTVTISYYDVLGAFHSSQTQTIASKASATFYPIPPSANTFTGTAVLTASRNIAVVVNHLKSGSGDVLMSHTGVNR